MNDPQARLLMWKITRNIRKMNKKIKNLEELYQADRGCCCQEPVKEDAPDPTSAVSE